MNLFFLGFRPKADKKRIFSLGSCPKIPQTCFSEGKNRGVMDGRNEAYNMVPKIKANVFGNLGKWQGIVVGEI